MTPQAMGELFVNPHEWMPLITARLIDYVRMRVSYFMAEDRRVDGSIVRP